ncbi:MAG TPA: uridine kinase [Mycobacteriales bacterium]|nr:uridine kinase [Mycobacteriales bacterium]
MRLPGPRPVRVLLDGVGGAELADTMVPGLVAAGRPPLRVRAVDFLRPAGERLEHGREDAEAFRTSWLDAAGLEREVLTPVRDGRYLPALRDAARDRSARAPVLSAPERSVLLLDGILLLGRGLPAELTVHLALSPAALRRRGVPEWQLPAFAAYEAQAAPRQVCDVLVLADDPARPAVRARPVP